MVRQSFSFRIAPSEALMLDQIRGTWGRGEYLRILIVDAWKNHLASLPISDHTAKELKVYDLQNEEKEVI